MNIMNIKNNKLENIETGDIVHNNIMELLVYRVYGDSMHNAIIFYDKAKKTFLIGKDCYFTEHDEITKTLSWNFGNYDFNNFESADKIAKQW